MTLREHEYILLILNQKSTKIIGNILMHLKKKILPFVKESTHEVT